MVNHFDNLNTLIKVFNINKDTKKIIKQHLAFTDIEAVELSTVSNVRLKNLFDDLDSYAQTYNLTPIAHLKIGRLLKYISDIILERLENENDRIK